MPGVSLYPPLMAKEYVCYQCEAPEARCKCIRYCCLCHAQFDVRLCEDGLYYCSPCRESCDLRAQYKEKT